MTVELVMSGSGWKLMSGEEEVGSLYVVERPADIYIYLRHQDVVLDAIAPPRVDWRSVAGALLGQFGMVMQ